MAWLGLAIQNREALNVAPFVKMVFNHTTTVRGDALAIPSFEES